MKILYIRLLTACNAGCDMCSFRFSKDPFRVTMENYIDILDAVKNSGYDWIRFTGGEPLLHPHIVEFVKMATDKNVGTSIISNGILFGHKMDALVKAGLKQIILSIDGYGAVNDSLRKHIGLFKQNMDNLKKAKRLGLNTRVNTVVSPVNCVSLLDLQEKLTELKVDMWEVTPIKQESRTWRLDNKEVLIQTIKTLYSNTNLLVPMGRAWPTESEEVDFFEKNIMPRNGIGCRVVEDIRFLDVEQRRLYPCNMIPHRNEKLSVYIDNYKNLELDRGRIKKIAEEYSKEHCAKCTGCSSSALGYRFNEKGINY